MNIKNNRKSQVVPLFEASEQEQIAKKMPKHIDGINKQQLQTVLVVKSKQFSFDCGAVMASIKTDTGNMFGLKHHADKSSNVDEFILSVSKFIQTTGENLTEQDKQRLTKEYVKR